MGACRRDGRAARRWILPLVCGDLDMAAGDGAFCDTAADCDRGICALARTCLEPCVADADCSGGFVCRPVYALTSVSSAQPLRGCVAPQVLHDGVRSEELPVTRITRTGTLTTPGLPAAATFQLFRSDVVALQVQRVTDAAC
ncbi:MAG: hypothetical protein R3B99_07125 [Polyangiales bacterium]